MAANAVNVPAVNEQLDLPAVPNPYCYTTWALNREMARTEMGLSHIQMYRLDRRVSQQWHQAPAESKCSRIGCCGSQQGH